MRKQKKSLMKLIKNLKELKNGDSVIYSDSKCSLPQVISFIGMNPLDKESSAYFMEDSETVRKIRYKMDGYNVNRIYRYTSEDYLKILKDYYKHLGRMIKEKEELNMPDYDGVVTVYTGDEEPDPEEMEDN